MNPFGVSSPYARYAQYALGCLGRITSEKIAPKVFIITMFKKEAANWLSDESTLNFNHTIVLPGLSRGYQEIRCTADSTVCLLVTGIARNSITFGSCSSLTVSKVINAALAISALTSSTVFDLSKTYFMLSGIAGVNPKAATIGTVAFAKYVVQIDLQLEFDGREIPSTWRTGYVPMGAASRESYPQTLHGSEVFELNDDLRQLAMSFARTASLEDSAAAATNRALYSGSPGGVYHAATLDPRIVAGDVTAGNVFFHGNLLCEGFERVVKLYTSGNAEYYMTAQEDTAILAALLRAALQKQVDFSRIILMRAGSNFDRSYSSSEPPSIPFVLDHGGFAPACQNLYLSGLKVIEGILEGWPAKFENGVEAKNYIGDVFGSLGGVPDFGPGKDIP